MNEKEALTGLKNLSQIFKLCIENDVKLKDFNIMNPKAYKEAIETFLDLYNKEKEKNKELEKYKIYYEEMEEVNKKFIAVDKIKEKIEETNNEKLNYSEDEYYLENEIKGYAIDKLKD